MFRDREVSPYADDAELVGLIYALVRPHRRWVMDPGN
jgi:hypothetical protein